MRGILRRIVDDSELKVEIFIKAEKMTTCE